MDISDAHNLIQQLRALGDLFIILMYGMGIIFIGVGTFLIPAASSPMNSTSWFGRQINPFMVGTYYLAGAMLIVLPITLDMTSGVIFESGFNDSSNPLNWHDEQLSNDEMEVLAALVKTIFGVIGLVVVMLAIFAITKLAAPSGPQEKDSPTRIVVRMLIGVVLMFPDRIAAGAANILPILSPLAEFFGTGTG